ncbi:MAG TPA: TIGR03066 family protein [Urbifossiella sp.]|jgi:uncharacterized protein (TIGR03066 family)|nr:TIGR03066 family protein [Urbifossiella sp.]
MRYAIGGVLLLALASAAAAEEKIDAKKLLGKWERKDSKKETAFIVEFAKDGKLIVTSGKDFKTDGTYKLDKDKLTIQLKIGENEVKDTVTITKLTDTELEYESGSKKTRDTFLRLKPGKRLNCG